jgi:hypothetical protein
MEVLRPVVGYFESMAYYTNMAGASEAVAGMNAQYNLSGDGDNQVIGGLCWK